MGSFTTSDGLTIHYDETGSGKPILCLAGLTRNGRDFDFVAPHLGRYRLITMDYRGRGLSDRDPDFMNYNILREAQDAVELLDHLQLERVAILGTSRGGLIAMTLAATRPERLSAVILNDIGPEVAPAGLDRIMDYVGKRPAAQTLDQAARAMKDAMETEFPGVPLARWRAQVEFLFAPGTGGLELRYDPKLRDALLSQGNSGPVPDLWPLYGALGPLPAGAIRGANSDLLGPGTFARMRREIPGLIAAEVPDRGHVPFLDEPQALEVIRAVMEMQ